MYEILRTKSHKIIFQISSRIDLLSFFYYTDIDIISLIKIEQSIVPSNRHCTIIIFELHYKFNNLITMTSESGCLSSNRSEGRRGRHDPLTLNLPHECLSFQINALRAIIPIINVATSFKTRIDHVMRDRILEKDVLTYLCCFFLF